MFRFDLCSSNELELEIVKGGKVSVRAGHQSSDTMSSVIMYLERYITLDTCIYNVVLFIAKFRQRRRVFWCV